MSSLFIKIIALITMTIDHSGSILFNNNQILRLIGRLSFPFYGFMLVEGFNHTKNDTKRFLRYLLSIFILGCISEIIYDYYFFDTTLFIYNQNILFTLSIALICMYIYEKESNTFFKKIFSLIIVFYISLLSSALFLDYGFLGIMLIFGYFLANKSKYNKVLIIIITLLYFCLNVLLYGFKLYFFGILISIVPLVLYNGKKGYNSKIIKYIFYIYYPFHIFILLIIKLYLKN